MLWGLAQERSIWDGYSKTIPKRCFRRGVGVVAPYLALLREDAPQRTHDLREVFNALIWIVRTGSAWRYMPHDLPAWEAVYQQTQRWLNAGEFEAMVHHSRCRWPFEGIASEPQRRSSTSHSEVHSRERFSGRLRRAQGEGG